MPIISSLYVLRVLFHNHVDYCDPSHDLCFSLVDVNHISSSSLARLMGVDNWRIQGNERFCERIRDPTLCRFTSGE
jgi:hypothetical protein